MLVLGQRNGIVHMEQPLSPVVQVRWISNQLQPFKLPMAGHRRFVRILGLPVIRLRFKLNDLLRCSRDWRGRGRMEVLRGCGDQVEAGRNVLVARGHGRERRL
jgi:hypothetical protein